MVDQVPEAKVPSEGTQQPGTALVIPPQNLPPYAPRYVDEAFENSLSDTRGFGNTLSQLAMAHLKERSFDMNALREDLAALRRQVADLTTQVNDEKTAKKVLTERLAGAVRVRNAGNLCSTVGALLLGLAVKLCCDKLIGFGIATAVLAVVLILFSWLSGSRSEK